MADLVDGSDLQLLRVAVYLAVVVLLLATVPFGLGLAGVDIRGTADADGGSVALLSATGDTPDEEGTSLGTVELDIAVGTHSEPVDLDRVTVFWVADRTYRVTAPASAESANGTFLVDGDTVLDGGERASLQFDLGSDDIDRAEEFGERLTAGESVRVVVLTSDGSSERELTVPDPIGDPPISL